MSSALRGRLAVAIDTGGTFTDVTLLDRASGRLWNAKTPSTPMDPSRGFMDGILKALDIAERAPSQISQVVHGTTVATNLILEGKGAKAGLMTTAGFRHVLEIGRHDIPRKSNMYSWVKPQRPVPPERIAEIPGMLASDGREIEALDEAAVRIATARLRAQGVDAIAICFLHSYANPLHEERARDIIREEWSEAMVSLSSEVLPVFREYERSMATILNVYVMPAVSTYVGRLEDRLSERSIKAPLLLMKSSGGVTGSQTVRREPVQTALSGPAAGVVGAQLIGRLAGYPNLIGVDIGGTSADISLIKNGEPGMTMKGRVGEWPLTIPMVDINTIGAGGGSIARVSDVDGLRVGPESAGALPGPACYGQGGVEPTVSDAHVVLGHLPPRLLDGSMALDVGAARRAIEEKIARPLGLDVYDAARGILALIDNTMVGAIRVVSVERGHDPRDFALLPFGGAGPLHGGSLARLLGIRTVVVPPAPGVLSALGLLVSNLKSDYSRTSLQKGPEYDFAQMTDVFEQLEREALAWFEAEGVREGERETQRLASLRYKHQGFELTIPWPAGEVTMASVTKAIEDFHAHHESAYTFAQRDMPVEIVTLHVQAVGRMPQPTLSELASGGKLADARVGAQLVHFANGARDCAVYDRSGISAGAQIDGPAIVTQLDATTLILADQIASVDRYGNLVIREA